MPVRRFPFKTHDVFFMALQANRQAAVPNDYQVTVGIGLAMGLRTDRIIEAQLEISTTGENLPVSFSAKVVGLFKADDDYKFPAPEEAKLFLDEFMTERAISVLWGYADVTIRHLLTSLGANVVKLLPELNPPSVFGTGTPMQAPLPLENL